MLEQKASPEHSGGTANLPAPRSELPEVTPAQRPSTALLPTFPHTADAPQLQLAASSSQRLARHGALYDSATAPMACILRRGLYSW